VYRVWQNQNNEAAESSAPQEKNRKSGFFAGEMGNGRVFLEKQSIAAGKNYVSTI
jgi:hypothetical protein